MNFNEVYSLSYSLFLLYSKEAWIYGLKQTEKGREFLETLWGLTRTEADYAKIREFKAMKGGS